MKIHKFETHDRLTFFKKDQEANVFKGAEECLKSNPLSLALQENSPYIYLFAHPRTLDNGDKAMYWQPRLSKPSAQTNSYLFRAKSKTDEVEVCWLIPPRELWLEYTAGKLVEHEIVIWSIRQFQSHRIELEKPHPDDMPEELGKNVLRKVLQEHDERKKPKPKILEETLL